jgi:hypothetical protein
MRAAWRMRAVLAAGILAGATAPEGAADSLDQVQLGVGMGAVGAIIGATAGSTGALVGGVVGVGVGVGLAGQGSHGTPRDPEHAAAVEAERAAWAAERQASEERLRDEQRAAFQARLRNQHGGSGNHEPLDGRADP